MVQDGVMDCGRQICAETGRRDSCHRLAVPSTDSAKSLLLVDYDHIQNMLNQVDLTHW